MWWSWPQPYQTNLWQSTGKRSSVCMTVAWLYQVQDLLLVVWLAGEVDPDLNCYTCTSIPCSVNRIFLYINYIYICTQQLCSSVIERLIGSIFMVHVIFEVVTVSVLPLWYQLSLSTCRKNSPLEGWAQATKALRRTWQYFFILRFFYFVILKLVLILRLKICCVHVIWDSKKPV